MAERRTTQTASHWGVYSVATENGAVVDVQPFAPDADPTPLMHGLPEMVHSPLRIQQPHIRAGYLRRRGASRGDRGADGFVPVSWETALTIITEELERVKAEFGNESIYGGSYGWASAGRLHHSPSVLKRFLGLHGGYTDKRGNHSFGAALGIVPYVVGNLNVTELVVPWPSIVAHTELLVMFGGANTKNMQVGSGGTATHKDADWIAKAAARGLPVVNISPSRSDVAGALHAEWIPIRPNTDTALMIGIAHCLLTENRHDRDFLSRYCEGFGAVANYLNGVDDGTPKTARWAAEITTVPEETIRALARRMSAARTLVTTTWSVQRADHGEMPVWMTITLAAMLGQIGLPGGGFSLGFGAVSGITVPRPAGIPRPTIPLGPNPVRTHVPVGRVADMLLNPGAELQYNGTTIRYPDTRLIYSVGGNPFHHNCNLNRFLHAWQMPETIIVHEPWWSPPAKYADIVLPATTTMERNDILAAELERSYVAMHQVVAPVGMARNDIDIFAELAARLGFEAAYTEGRDEMGWLRHMYATARASAFERGFEPPDFDTFWRVGFYEFPLAENEEIVFEPFRSDPHEHKLTTDSGKIELFSNRIAGFGYDDCPPHAAWLEPREWLGGAAAQRFPLHLLSNQPARRLHSQNDPSAFSKSGKVNGREVLTMHPADAERRGIHDDDVVRVFNDRGAFLASARITETLAPGVLLIPTGAWYDPLVPGRTGSLEKHGNPNVVTLDTGTSRLAQAPVAQTVIVEVERYDGAPPPVTAFNGPPIVVPS